MAEISSIDDLLTRIKLVEQIRKGEIDVTSENFLMIFQSIVIWQEEYFWRNPYVKEQVENATKSQTGCEKRRFFEEIFLRVGLKIDDNYTITFFGEPSDSYESLCAEIRSRRQFQENYCIPDAPIRAIDRPWTYLSLNSNDIYDHKLGKWRRAIDIEYDMLLENSDFPGSARIDIIRDDREPKGRVILIAHGEQRGIATFVTYFGKMIKEVNYSVSFGYGRFTFHHNVYR